MLQLDVIERMRRLEEILKGNVQELIVTKDVKLNCLKKWCNNLKRLKDKRNAAHLNAQIHDSDSAWNTYRQLRNRYNNCSRAATNNCLRNTIMRCYEKFVSAHNKNSKIC